MSAGFTASSARQDPQPDDVRPVVLVHGYMSDHRVWDRWTGPDGLIAEAGLDAWAIGDDRVPGRLRMGDPERPAARTNTIEQNASLLGVYVDGVQAATGARAVDLVTHGMGGLVAREYIDRVMSERDVARLIMLGAPHGGTRCALLPMMLGHGLPASIELQPAHLREFFNRRVLRRHGVPFHQVAGTAITDQRRAPCTDVPSDGLLDRDSAAAIPLQIVDSQVEHGRMTRSDELFRQHVQPLLSRPMEDADDPDPMAVPVPFSAAQVAMVVSGRISPGRIGSVTIPIGDVEALTVAVYHPEGSIGVELHAPAGAPGQPVDEPEVIEVDPLDAVGAQAMYHRGLGVRSPQPGAWTVEVETVELDAADPVPAEGVPFAHMTQVVGGPQLRVDASPRTVAPGDTLRISGTLDSAAGDRSLDSDRMAAIIYDPDGGRHPVEMTPSESGGPVTHSAQWQPEVTGLHAVVVMAGRYDSPDANEGGSATDGAVEDQGERPGAAASSEAASSAPVARSAVAVVDVRAASGRLRQVVLSLALVLGVVAGAGLWLWRRQFTSTR